MPIFRTHFPAFIRCLYVVFSTISCTTIYPEDSPFGVSPTKAGYIPARMALSSCMTWPERASRMRGQPLSTASAEEMQKLCSEFDQFVAGGFENQPFMNGLSPKYTEQMYRSATGNATLRQSITKEWQAKPDDCAPCRNVPAFFNASIAPRKDWGVWLSKFSSATKGTDALLIPMVVYYSTTKEDERGLLVARRSALATLLLVDTSTGELIWSGGREAEVVSKSFAEDPASKTLAPPGPEELYRRLFTDALWLGFPGRQVYK